MDTMSFYFGIEDLNLIRCSTPKRKDEHKETDFTEIFKCKLNHEDEKIKLREGKKR